MRREEIVVLDEDVTAVLNAGGVYELPPGPPLHVRASHVRGILGVYADRLKARVKPVEIYYHPNNDRAALYVGGKLLHHGTDRYMERYALEEAGVKTFTNKDFLAGTASTPASTTAEIEAYRTGKVGRQVLASALRGTSDVLKNRARLLREKAEMFKDTKGVGALLEAADRLEFEANEVQGEAVILDQ